MQKSDNFMKEGQIAEYAELKYTVIDGEINFDFARYFKGVFPKDRLHYAHVNHIKANSKVIEIDGIKFAPCADVFDRLSSYHLKKSQYVNKPENYKGYLDAMNNPDVFQDDWNKMAGKASEEFGIEVQELNLQFKDLSYLTQEGVQREVKKRQPVLKLNLESQERMKQLRDQIKLLEDQQSNDQTNIGELNNDIKTRKEMYGKSIEQLNSKDRELQRLRLQLKEEKEISQRFAKQIKDDEKSLEEINDQKLAIEKQLKESEASRIKWEDTASKQKEEFEDYVQVKRKHKKESDADFDKLYGQRDELKEEVARMAKELIEKDKTIEENDKHINEDKLAFFLRRKSTKTVVAALSILAFLPFTVMALYKFIAIETVYTWQAVCVGLLCLAMGVFWDAAILIFAFNGKIKMSNAATIFQAVFIAAKFDFFSRLYMLLSTFSLNSITFQELIVISCIVIYPPLIINQFTHLSK